MHRELRNQSFAATLNALVAYANDGRGYSFVSNGNGNQLVITVTLDDAAAYQRTLAVMMAARVLAQADA